MYRSLAATGKGHLIDIALKKIFGYQLEIVWEPETELPFHPKGLKFNAIDETGSVTSESTFCSTGGGTISEEGEKKTESDTYDPVCGLVQISCIERNVFVANHAFTCASFSIVTGGEHIISFDEVVHLRPLSAFKPEWFFNSNN